MRKAIIFDMDGVLFDSIPFAQQSFIDRHPGMTAEMYKEIHSGNFHEESKKYSNLKIRETEEEKVQRQNEYAEAKSNTGLVVGMKELLEILKSSGKILVLNTNAYDKNSTPLLEKSGVKEMFDFIANAEVSKSKVEKFKIIEEKYNLANKEMTFITDSLGDIREADEANIPTIAVTWGVHDESFFNREKHDNLVGIAHSVAELKDFIK